MAEDRIDSIIDRDSISKEVGDTISDLNSLIQSIGSVRKAGTDILGAKTTSDFNDLKSKIDSLIVKTDQLSETVVQNSGEQNKNSKSKSDNSTQTDKLTQANSRLTLATSKEGQELAGLNIKITEQNRLNKINAALEQAIPDSIEYHRVKVAQLTIARDKLVLSESSDRDVLAQLNGEIDANNLAIQANLDLDKQRISNIGNYNGQLGVLSKALKGVGGLGLILSKALGIDPSVFEGLREAGRAVRDIRHASEGGSLFSKDENNSAAPNIPVTQPVVDAPTTLPVSDNANTESINSNSTAIEENSNDLTTNSELKNKDTVSTESNTVVVDENTASNETNIDAKVESVLIDKEKVISENLSSDAIIENTISQNANTESTEEATVAGVANEEEVKNLTLLQKLYAFVVGESTGAMKIFKIALASTGIAILLLGLIALVSYFNKAYGGVNELSKATDDQSNANKKLSDTTKQSADEIKKQADEVKKAKEEFKDFLKTIGDINNTSVAGSQDQIAVVRALSNAVLDGNKSYKERNNAITQLKEINKDYFGDLSLEADKLSTLKAKVDEYTQAILAQAVAKGFQEEIGKVAVEISKQQRTYSDAAVAVDKYSKELAKAKKDYLDYSYTTNAVVPTTQIDIATASLEKARKEFEKQGLNIKILKDQYNDLGVALNNAVAQTLKIQPLKEPPAPKSHLNDINKDLDNERKALLEAAQKEIQLQIDKDKAIVDDERNSFNVRISAEKNFYDDSLKLINTTRSFQLEDVDQKVIEQKKKANVEFKSNAQGLSSALIAIDKNAAAQREKIQADYNLSVNKLEQDDGKTIIGLIDKRDKELVDHDKTTHEQRLQTITDNYNDEVEKEDENYLKKLKAAGGNQKDIDKADKEHNQNLLDIQLSYQLDSLQEDIEFTKQVLQLAELRAQATGKQSDIDAVKSTQQKLHDLEIALIKDVTGYYIKSNQSKTKSDSERLADFKKIVDKIGGYAKQLVTTISGFENAAYEKEKNQIKDLEDTNEAQHQKEQDTINQTITDQDDKNTALAESDARYNATKSQLDRQQQESDERKAKFDKASGIANIIINTAAAIVKALPDVELSITAGIIGATELAVAIATQVPHYKYGTGYHKGGSMIVGDGGISELIELPDGSMMVSAPRSTLMSAPEGTKVYKDARVALQNLSVQALPQIKVNTSNVNNNAGTERAINKMGRNIVRAIRAQPVSVHQGERRYKTMTKIGSSFRTYLDNNL